MCVCVCVFVCLFWVMLLLWYVRVKIKSKATCQSDSQSVSQTQLCLMHCYMFRSQRNRPKQFQPHQHFLSFTLTSVGLESRLPFTKHRCVCCTAFDLVTRPTVCHANNTSLSHATDILRSRFEPWTAPLQIQAIALRNKRSWSQTRSTIQRPLHISFKLLRLPCTPLPLLAILFA